MQDLGWDAQRGGGKALNTNLTHVAISFLLIKEGDVSSHTALSAWPYSEGPRSFLHVEVLGLHLPLVCFGIKPLGFPWWSGS